MFAKAKNALVFKKANETLLIEPWGKNSLRVRSTLESAFSDKDWGLTEKVSKPHAVIIIDANGAQIKNGTLSARLNNNGVLSFYKEEKLLFREYYRCYDPSATPHSCCTKVIAREFKGLSGGGYELTVRFEPNDGEKIFGMGQYPVPYLDMKGCSLELAQRNSQISIPFALSSLGYGFLWNNPAVGHVNFAKNLTEWTAESTMQMDYWVTAGDTPAQILEQFTDATGRAPVMPPEYLGFWQCKLRYRTQDELLSVARRYKELGIHLDVMVIDFFHWPRQGDWCFDPEYWPDPKAMCDELHAMGTKVMVSVWPSVDKKSSHYYEMLEKGYLVRTERGSNQTYDFNGDCLTFDATNPEAREYVWKICKKNYASYGIDMFWLDNAEPDYNVYDFCNYRYQLGPALSCSNIYPKLYSQTFYDGMKASGKKTFVNLERCAWVGSQKYSQVLWNGDVQSSWECLQDSVMEGLNIGLAGIPWWTTDIGGFMYGNPNDPAFVELLIRWFEFAVFTPVLRLHGDRDPHDIPPLDKDPERGYGGGYLFTGQPNEIWSYGNKAQKIMEAQIQLRESLKPYISDVMKEAAKNGSPVMRAMFYEFPGDAECWKLTDQYMFGSKYLVAPVLCAKEKERNVYLPAGTWENLHTRETIEGGRTVTVATPLEQIPVFVKK
ncbi:MAG: glycoside hydrolase family 31 protein [Spirochaetaceae bacterium]|nr:glycoside hydrolase family 31 protein [Spirochaetaceae bacterium]